MVFVKHKVVINLKLNDNARIKEKVGEYVHTHEEHNHDMTSRSPWLEQYLPGQAMLQGRTISSASRPIAESTDTARPLFRFKRLW